ncbi:DUF3050 domain-containing protein [Tumebacillus algifaecis]|nr:DUF3050 domain-containing protein [Tumebacillus algifaecis]
MQNSQTFEEVRDSLLQHPVYQKLTSAERVRQFMEHHVFAVWDFMSLLKRLQRDLTVTTVPWMPGREAQYARFINEIVLGEETDEDGRGGYISHFDLYIEAMEEAGADTAPIRQFLARLAAGSTPAEALNAADIPQSVRQFVETTLDIALHGQSHQVAAAFFYGREDIIPDMFTHLVRELEASGKSAERLLYYLKRHIELDGDEHGPLAERLLSYLCAGDPQKEQEALATAKQCLQSRVQLWDGVSNSLTK